MDLASIKTGLTSLKTIKDILTACNDIKNNTDVLIKVNAAVTEVGKVQDTLYELREELFSLQEKNQQLKEKIKEYDNWEEELKKYEFIKTEGGAEVYQHILYKYYICTNCINKKEIQILQDRKVFSGDFDCPGCKAMFPVKKSRNISSIQAI